MNTYRITYLATNVYVDVPANCVADAQDKGCVMLDAEDDEVGVEIVLSNGGTLGTHEEDEFIVFSNEHGDEVMEFELRVGIVYVRESSGNIIGQITETTGSFKFEPLHQSGYEPIEFVGKTLIDVEFEMSLMFVKVAEQDPS